MVAYAGPGWSVDVVVYCGEPPGGRLRATDAIGAAARLVLQALEVLLRPAILALIARQIRPIRRRATWRRRPPKRGLVARDLLPQDASLS